MVQWLRRLFLNAGGVGSIPDQGTRSQMLLQRDPVQLNQNLRRQYGLDLFLILFFSPIER